MKNWMIVAIIAVIVVLLGFFIWVFWTVSGILMEISGTTKYGWPLQLVIFLILWAICSGFGAKVR